MIPRPAVGAPLLPPVRAGWPATLLAGGPAAGRAGDGGAPPDAVARALAEIRAGALWWPAPRRGAARPRALAVGPEALAAARARFSDADVAAVAAPDAAAVDPARLEAAFAPPSAPVLAWAAIGGLAVWPDGWTDGGLADGDAAPALLAAARGVSPWGGGALALEAAVAAQATLRRAALRVGGRAGLVAMSRWKRRCLAPFLTGADGPPAPARSVAAARARGLTPVVWGAAEDGPEAAAGEPAPLRVEDGFLRSVGLGLRHVPPLSLVIDARPPHFDATRPNGFEALVAEADFTPALRARARALAARIVALGLTKYNLEGAEALPDPRGRAAVLVAGQLATDASVRLGGRLVRDDLGLLEAARARFPDGFLLYKPHPDVVTGLRPGGAPAEAVARLADATAPRATARDCLDWADRVVVNTSLIGFEALMRGRSVTTLGRPFYAGWGLTDDADPPPRPRRLDLDDLLAAALILYPTYIDPVSRLPAPPETAVEALARIRAGAGRPAARLTRLWRDAASWALSRL